MTTNTKAIYNQLKDNPDFLNEVTESMSDAICKLIVIADMEMEGDEKSIIISIAARLAKDRLDIRDMLI